MTPQRGQTAWVCLIIAGLGVLALMMPHSPLAHLCVAVLISVMLGSSLVCQEISRIPAQRVTVLMKADDPAPESEPQP